MGEPFVPSEFIFAEPAAPPLLKIDMVVKVRADAEATSAFKALCCSFPFSVWGRSAVGNVVRPCPPRSTTVERRARRTRCVDGHNPR